MSKQTNTSKTGGNDITIEQVKKSAAEVAEETKQQASSAATQAKDALLDVTNEAKNEAASTLRSVKHQTFVAAEDKKDLTTDRLNNVAGMLRQTSHEFRSQEDETFAEYTDLAAEQVEKFAGYLDTRDVGELLDNVQDFARRQPEVFVAGALAAGFLVGRFLKSSQSRNDARNGNYNNRVGQRRRYTPYSDNFYERDYDRSFNSGATAFNNQRSIANPDGVTADLGTSSNYNVTSTTKSNGSS